jgi:hypothetical protein
MKRLVAALLLGSFLPAATVAWSRPQGQQRPPVPQPYPRTGQPVGTAGQKPPAPAQQPPAQPARPASSEVPTEATLGLPIYPTSQFLASYDAGRGQRYYLFGTTASFDDVVSYYKSVLKQKGELVFEEPATHMFEVGRFKEDTMAFPPSVTVKDYTWGGMQGYPNPKPGAEPARFRTVIQIVPIPAGTTVAGR